MIKAPLQINKNWASSKCLVRKKAKMYLPQILGMWNSKMALPVQLCSWDLHICLVYQEKTYFQVVKSQIIYLI